jgi:ADP-dependent NAD(P)H-hydrate dehydratase / NAD(P)H-hydrate epimerase
MDILLSGPQMAEVDRIAIEQHGIPGRSLMENAGIEVAQCIREKYPASRRLFVACGRGNNGGDGFVAARHLYHTGTTIELFVFGEKARLRGDAASAFEDLCRQTNITPHFVIDTKSFADFRVQLLKADLILDALLGTGLKQNVRGLIKEAILSINDTDSPVVAIDLPSGIQASTGAVMGLAVKAQQTLTFSFEKLGHHLYPGADHRGHLHMAQIGIPRKLTQNIIPRSYRLRAKDAMALMPPRPKHSHKGTFGHVWVQAGQSLTPGAALLCLGGALRSGAGLVTWETNSHTLRHAHQLPPEVMLRLDQDAVSFEESYFDKFTSGVIGPGLGRRETLVQDVAVLLTKAPIPLCLDADALWALSHDLVPLKARREATVITPHPKEMAGLLGLSTEQILQNPVEAARNFSMHHGCVTVLKGSTTVIAQSDGEVCIVHESGSALATGGTGDILAGLIGGLLAQGIEAYSAAKLGTIWHAMAGCHAAATHTEACVLATDVVACLSFVRREWEKGSFNT